jgi:hypothetical protein
LQDDTVDQIKKMDEEGSTPGDIQNRDEMRPELGDATKEGAGRK